MKDAHEMTDTLADEIVRWDRETHAILLSIKRIVSYFGTDEEYEWLLAALHEPEDYLAGVLPAFRDPAWDQNITWVSIPPFTFERGVAEKINPLLVIITELVPNFIPWAREELDPAHFKAVMRYAGVFLGDFYCDFCDLIWRRFPDLALEGYPIGDPPRNFHEARRSTWPRKDSNNTTETFADAIVRWDEETRALLTSIKRIVEYWGTDEEYESLPAALRGPEASFEAVLSAFRDPAWRAEMPGDAGTRFMCERSIAEKISPLLQILVEPEPAFLRRAGDELELTHASAVRAHFETFNRKIRETICDPLWQSFPELAPQRDLLAADRATRSDAAEPADTKPSGPET